MYGSYFHFEFERPDPDSVEMRVERCFGDACRFTVRTTDDPFATRQDALDRRIAKGEE